MDLKALGQRIKAARKRANLTQQQLAVAVETKKSVISAYEHGTRNVSVNILNEIAKALDCDLKIDLEPKP